MLNWPTPHIDIPIARQRGVEYGVHYTGQQCHPSNPEPWAHFCNYDAMIYDVIFRLVPIRLEWTRNCDQPSDIGGLIFSQRSLQFLL